jgi:FkbH-like protein
MKYSEILKQNQSLVKSSEIPIYKVSVLSNIIVHQSKEIIELMLRREGVNAYVTFGNYDNIVQDSSLHNQADAVILFWELSNITEGLHYKIGLLNGEIIDQLTDKVSAEIDLVIKNLEDCPLILFNQFSSLAFSSSTILSDSFDVLGRRLNSHLHLQSQQVGNLTLIDVDFVLASKGIDLSIDWRYFASSKALYTVSFFQAYAQSIKPYLMAVNGRIKKVLVFDCDNTLWHGILGEDGFNGIDMSAESSIGRLFQEVQSIALSLSKQGVLLALCSKNNTQDVNNVLETHSDILIKHKDLAIKKVNWLDKVKNIREMSKELNLGLDSFVFVDDSDFEVNLIRERLPQVKVLQVPSKLHLYPKMLRENIGLFYRSIVTKEDADRTYLYKKHAERVEAQTHFANIEDYLESLNIVVQVYENYSPHISRIVQLSQKTNQFNLTTIRHTMNDIDSFIQADDAEVYSFAVTDKYGDSGVTGLCIIRLYDGNWTIDSFLLSCRVIGRNVEYNFMDYLIKILKNKNIDTLSAAFIETKKNIQVVEFYDKCGFELCNIGDFSKDYMLKIGDYKPQQTRGYIKVINGI